MSNNTATNPVEADDDQEEDEFSQDDFGFIIGPDGELKSLMYPQHLMEDPPDEILQILNILGIDDIASLENPTLH